MHREFLSVSGYIDRGKIRAHLLIQNLLIDKTRKSLEFNLGGKEREDI